MSVLIKGMEMPRKCIRCPVNMYGRCLVNDDKDVSKATADAVRDKACPLVPVPEHGDLIDRSRLCDDSIGGDYGSGTRIYYAYEVEHAPVIIPAEDGDT